MSNDANNSLIELFKLPEPENHALTILPESDSVSVISELSNQDIKYVRDNLLKIIEEGQVSLSRLVQLAMASQDTEYFDSLAKLIKTMTDANKDLINIHKEDKVLNQKHVGEEKVVNQNLFVGSTLELKEFLKKKNDV